MKSRFVACFFAFVFSAFGINNFYCNDKTKGIIDCVLTILFGWTVIVPSTIMIINTVRGCMYLWCNTDWEFNEKFVKGYTDPSAGKVKGYPVNSFLIEEDPNSKVITPLVVELNKKPDIQ